MADFKLGRIKFKWQGDWTTSTDYVKDDIIKFNANSYVCITNHTSSSTRADWFANDFGNWEMYVPGVYATGGYSGLTTYYKNDIATYNGSSYISITNNNTGNPPPSANWVMLAQGNPDMTTNGVYYVSTSTGSNLNDGKTISTAFKTLRYACDNVTGPASIYVKAGTYEETLPITVAAGVSIIGDGMRDTEVKPLLTKVATPTYVASGSSGTTVKVSTTTGILQGMVVTGTNVGSNRSVATVVDSNTVVLNTAPSGSLTNAQTLTFTQTNLSTDASPKANNLSTMFLLSNETMIHQLLMTGMSGYTPNVSTPSDITTATIGGVFVALNPASPVTTKSPYIKDCTAKSTGGIGALVDGSVHATGYKSMVFWAYNQVHDDGVGIWVKDNGKCEAVSCFTYFAHMGYAATGGGKIRSLSGNNSYGTYGAVSRGYDVSESPITASLYGGFLTGTSTGVYTVGETITQASSGANGTVLNVQQNGVFYKLNSGTFNTTNIVTGGSSGATMVPSAVGGQKGYVLIVNGLATLPKVGGSVELDGDSTAYVIQTVSGAYVNSSSIITLILTTEKVTASATGTAVRVRYNFSQIRLTGHDFLSIGTGNITTTNYPGQFSQAAQPNNETINVFPGRVYYVTTDQDGNFRVGAYFAVNQATGKATLNASAFDLSGLSSLRLGSVGAQLGAQVDEFSTDGTLSANSATKVPTQSAVRTYLGASYQTFAPATTNTYDLGASSYKWKDLYLSGNANVGTDLTVTGNLTVNGTTTTVNSTTLVVADKNIELAKISSPTDTTADGAGITVKGSSDKTFNWVNATTAWTSSETLNLLTGKTYQIAGATVLSATALGSNVVGSSLTSVGTLTGLTVSGTISANGSGGITTTQTTFSLVNGTATTVNIAGGASTVTIGASGGTITVGNNTLSMPNSGTTNGSLMFIDGGYFNVGTLKSSGGPYIGYGVKYDSVASNAFVSASSANVGRAAIDLSPSGNGSIRFWTGAAESTAVGSSLTQMANSMTLAANGNLSISGTFTENSSIVYKENVEPITGALEMIMQLCGVTYDRKNGSNKNEAGLIAEAVNKVIPNIVTRDEKGNPTGIQYTKLTAYLIESIKTLKEEIDSLKGKK